MFTRTVSALLIAAIVSCPLFCRNGLCQGCCSAKQSIQSTCPIYGTAHRCCKTTSHDTGDHGPSRCPNTSSCQGVCGGAVFEKPCKIDDDLESSFFLPLLSVTEVVVGSRLTQCRFYDVEHHHCTGSGNYGRSLRTLHMSFLC